MARTSLRVPLVILAVLIALTALAAYLRAASPAMSYVAARDGYLQQFAHADLDGDEHARTAEVAARRDLEARLRRAIGPLHIEGFADDGKINLTSLTSATSGADMLDGLVYSSRDGETRILATTSELLFRWLWSHKDLPRSVNVALKSEAFYTAALYADASFLRYADIPVKAPAATFATAMLFTHAQDVGSTIPDELVVTVLQESRAFIVVAPVVARMNPRPDCEPLRQEVNRRAESVLDDYVKTDRKDKTLLAQYARMEIAADGAYRLCFSAQASKDAHFPAVAAQAQTLIDALPAQ